MSSDPGAVERLLSVLDCFSEDEPALTAAEIAARTNIPLSTLHRLLRTLVEKRMLVRVPQHAYTIGPKLWQYGELSPLALRLRERAMPHLVRLYEATGENVHLGVLDGDTPESARVLYVGRLTGRLSIPTVSRAGGPGPLHATGVGKAILAGRDAAWLERYFTVPREKETVHTVTAEHELREEIAVIRARGYAVAREEMTLGNISVAVELPFTEGLPPIAVGLVVHLERADERRLSVLVQQAAREIHTAIRA